MVQVSFSLIVPKNDSIPISFGNSLLGVNENSVSVFSVGTSPFNVTYTLSWHVLELIISC